MTTHGFHLETLCISGEGQPEATIDLTSRLNVITGPSDTGKSYILQCIDFMLGGSESPKTIDESKAYSTAYLTIRPMNNGLLSLERALKGGSFGCFDGGRDAVNYAEVQILAAKHDPNADETVSALYLRLCGLSGKSILKNQAGESRTLSFRDIAKLILVDEERIFVQSSPILTEKLFKTPEMSVFKLLLTGHDDKGVVAKITTQTAKAQQQAQLNLMDELIASAETELSTLTLDATGLGGQAERVDAAIEQLTETLAAYQAELTEQEEVRRTSYESVQEIDSRRIVIRELLKRFDVLRRRYESDLARLNAIGEANRLFFELGSPNCPLCGSDGKPLAGFSKDLIEQACLKEAEKIRVLLTDLEKTTSQLAEEGGQLEQQRTTHTHKLNSALKQIQQVLLPTAKKSQADIQELVVTRRSVERATQLLNQVSLLKEKRSTLSKPLPKQARLSTPTEVRSREIDGLCQEIETLLQAWGYPDAGRVTFSETDQDIVISGRDRKSPGKGFRALSYAAFTIGLMRFCRKNQLPHPGFVVLDSPLVAFREPDSPDALKSDDVKGAFYGTLAECSEDEQIIILENEDPPRELQDRINYIHFTKVPGLDRYGFFPVVPETEYAELELIEV
jgi:hypothetical protein